MSKRRCSTRLGRLMSRTSMVARPTDVLPTSIGPSHAKCSFQDSVRGLKSGTNSSLRKGVVAGRIGSLALVALGASPACVLQRFGTAVFLGADVINLVRKRRARLGHLAILATVAGPSGN